MPQNSRRSSMLRHSPPPQNNRIRSQFNSDPAWPAPLKTQSKEKLLEIRRCISTRMERPSMRHLSAMLSMKSPLQEAKASSWVDLTFTWTMSSGLSYKGTESWCLLLPAVLPTTWAVVGPLPTPCQTLSSWLRFVHIHSPSGQLSSPPMPRLQ